MSANEIRNRLETVQEKISLAAQRANRDRADIRLVLVTKSHPIATVAQAIEAGARDLGENYAEEGREKILALGDDAPGLTWHMIGHLQSRKAAIVAAHFGYFQALDGLKLARRLDRFCAQQDRQLPVLLEYNVSGEATKFGWQAWDEKSWPALLPEINQIIELRNLKIQGLMTLAPFSKPGEAARPYFRKLVQLQSYLRSNFPELNWQELSMGMSQDYEVAVEEGATMVRVGQAILGPRPA